MQRADDWIKQSLKDISHSKESIKIQHYEWAVLAAQQGAEKAIKALFFENRVDVWGHSLFKLLQELPEIFFIPKRIIKAAKSLDKHYITSRYPNGFASGAPLDYYTLEDAEEAFNHSEKIFRFCKNQISTIRKSIE